MRAARSWPAGLVAINNELYGTTLGGGDRVPGYYRCGTIFKINQYGSARVIDRFRGDPAGANPTDALSNVNGVLHGIIAA
ncbi:MAG: hypothetical protein WA431_12405 [Candidatus Cybelea sp.]